MVLSFRRYRLAGGPAQATMPEKNTPSAVEVTTKST
jgi:hypothetical protein